MASYYIAKSYTESSFIARVVSIFHTAAGRFPIEEGTRLAIFSDEEALGIEVISAEGNMLRVVIPHDFRKGIVLSDSFHHAGLVVQLTEKGSAVSYVGTWQDHQDGGQYGQIFVGEWSHSSDTYGPTKAADLRVKFQKLYEAAEMKLSL